MTPTNTRASHRETLEEFIDRCENLLRLTENSAEHAAGFEKAILLRSADELHHTIYVAKNELTDRTDRTDRTGGRLCII